MSVTMLLHMWCRHSFIIVFLIFSPQVVEISEVKSKVKNRLVEWLYVRVVSGSQKALAIKNCVVFVVTILVQFLLYFEYCLLFGTIV